MCSRSGPPPIVLSEVMTGDFADLTLEVDGKLDELVI
jgi:hypothetical protein